MHTITVERTICTGHKVTGHEGKCRSWHGHNYKITVRMRSEELEAPGFVQDFGDVKAVIDTWDHKFLLWVEDEGWGFLLSFSKPPAPWTNTIYGIIAVPFNPTAENMAQHLCEHFFQGNIEWCSVSVEETESTKATYTLP